MEFGNRIECFDNQFDQLAKSYEVDTKTVNERSSSVMEYISDYTGLQVAFEAYSCEKAGIQVDERLPCNAFLNYIIE